MQTLTRILPGSESADRMEINLGKALVQLRRYLEAERELSEGIALLKRQQNKRPQEIEKAEGVLEDVRRLRQVPQGRYDGRW